MHKTVQDILNMKKEKKKISVITSYDYTLASLCDNSGIDVLLVGDSAGMVMLGYENTIPVTMDQMCMFTEAVSRARKNSLLVSDLPFMSYQASIEDAINNSGRLIKAGADAVKLEGGNTDSKVSLIECYHLIEGTGTLTISADDESTDLNLTGKGKYGLRPGQLKFGNDKQFKLTTDESVDSYLLVTEFRRN